MVLLCLFEVYCFISLLVCSVVLSSQSGEKVENVVNKSLSGAEVRGELIMVQEEFMGEWRFVLHN